MSDGPPSSVPPGPGDAAPREAWRICPLCGCRFIHGRQACGSCGPATCAPEACPHCGYVLAPPSALLAWLGRLAAALGLRRPAGRT
jgi:hypothetical protein